MHIESGIVQGAKILLSYGSAALCFGVAAKLAFDAIRDSGFVPFVVKTLLATFLVFMFFELFPHYSVGVSEVHFILGSSIFLIFGVACAAFGLAFGLLIQGLFFAPLDLPQYGMNITTLLLPLFALSLVAKRYIPKDVAYKNLAYRDVLKLSLTYQGGIVLLVAFWALYGGGFGVENLAQIASFGAVYLSVVLIEPLVDLALLWVVKNSNRLSKSPFVEARLYNVRKDNL